MIITIGWIVRAIRSAGEVPASIAFTRIVLMWMLFQTMLVLGGFYEHFHSVPPRFPVVVLPAVLFIVWLFLRKKALLQKLPLKTLTLLSIVRIPVEMVLYWLAHEGAIPHVLTFEGRNFDILMGITAPVAAFLFFGNKGEVRHRIPLIIWNIVGILLLLYIVVNAIISIPSVIQMQAFDQPNLAVMHLPYVFLPAVVVPIVMFTHVLSLTRLIVWKDAVLASPG